MSNAVFCFSLHNSSLVETRLICRQFKTDLLQRAVVFVLVYIFLMSIAYISDNKVSHLTK